jgi:FSR family fosmidomycin resistance protein-like MFS transporter
LLSLPNLIGNLIEPSLGILADVWRRRVLILGGGLFFTLSALLTAASGSFGLLLASFILFYPASGAFVSLSQAALMDSAPDRREHNMARWTFAGSVGVVAGPLLLSAAVALGVGWRGMFLLFALLALGLVFAASRFSFPNGTTSHAAARSASADIAETDPPLTFADGLRNASRALRRRDVLRWLALLQFSDLMLDVLYSLLALYFVDVVGVTAERAGLAVAVWTSVGLVGDFLLIPLLERVRGLAYLRFSAAILFVLYPAFLLAPLLGLKLVLLGLLGLFNAGWYAILQAQLYNALPGQSGTALAVNNASGLVGSLIPFSLGLIAQHAGLGAAMWLLLVGPVALLVGIPRRGKNQGEAES